MNLLAEETSPYLLQHKDNPVHWHAWNDAAWERAKSEQKLVLVSIGYSACHWCHVMEHEVFEDFECAELMNMHFVCIKVDREERPDVDSWYMDAVHLMGSQGGWPLNVFTLPDGRPLFGGTYFPKSKWIDTLEKLMHAFITRRIWMSTPLNLWTLCSNCMRKLILRWQPITRFKTSIILLKHGRNIGTQSMAG